MFISAFAGECGDALPFWWYTYANLIDLNILNLLLGTSAACTFLALLTKKWFEILVKVLKGALFISKKLYEFIVVKQNNAFEADRKNSIYTNIGEFTFTSDNMFHFFET